MMPYADAQYSPVPLAPYDAGQLAVSLNDFIGARSTPTGLGNQPSLDAAAQRKADLRTGGSMLGGAAIQAGANIYGSNVGYKQGLASLGENQRRFEDTLAFGGEKFQAEHDFKKDSFAQQLQLKRDEGEMRHQQAMEVAQHNLRMLDKQFAQSEFVQRHTAFMAEKQLIQTTLQDIRALRSAMSGSMAGTQGQVNMVDPRTGARL